MKYTLLALILLSATASFGAEFNLKDYVAKHIVVLDRAVMTFNYRNSKQEPTTIEEAFDQAAKITRGYFNLAQTDYTMAGPGLYVAVDPNVSRSFGAEKPQLFVITLKKGTRVFDARNSSPELDAYLLKTKCVSDDDKIVNSIEKMRNSKTESCRKVIIDAISSLNVEAILFSYSGIGSLTNCRSNRSAAFNVISASALDPAGISYFSDVKDLTTSPNLKDFIMRLYTEGLNDALVNSMIVSTTNTPAQRELPKPLTVYGDLNAADYERMKSKSIFLCGPRSKLDSDEDFTGFMEQFQRAFRSAGYDKAYNDAAVAYNLKTTKSFDLRYNRAVLQSQYQMLGLAKDDSKFEQFLKAKKLLDGSNYSKMFGTPAIDAFLKRVSFLLEDKPGHVTSGSYKVAMQYFNKLIKAKRDVIIKYAGSSPALYMKAGFGPRVTQLAMGSVFVYPLLNGPMPTDPNKDYSVQMEKNRDMAIELLKKCTLEYQDPAKTPEQIQAGDCGIVDLSKVED